jgi:hypothetical protein
MTIRDTRSEAGSLEWFTEKQRLIGEDAWALDSALFAFRSLRKIDQLWDGEDSEIRAGLFVAAVVSYCRPFTPARGAREYPIKQLKSRADFSTDLHKHFLELRDKLLAHADSKWFNETPGSWGMGLPCRTEQGSPPPR